MGRDRNRLISVLLRSIFRNGRPVSGKNLFPSNIAGLPTWYTIRVSKEGWVARKTDIDILIAMNAETHVKMWLSLGSGGAVIYDESLKLNELRSDLAYYAVPFDQLAATNGRRGEAAQAGEEHGLRGDCRESAGNRHGFG